MCLAQSPAATLAFTVSLEPASARLFHVTLRCDGLQGEIQDFKMPVWTPGYYRVMDYAKYVTNFRAHDGAGNTLPWEPVAKNTWRVATGRAPVVTVEYDVAGTTVFPAANSFSESRAHITPPGLFLHVAGMLQHPATITFKLPADWTRVSTGLDPVAGRQNTFSSPDFDTLYDSPMLIGNQEVMSFDVQRITHRVVIENVPAGVDRPKMSADLRRLVETSVRLIGDIPYKHYTFLMMGTGNGGIEHSNSASIHFNGNSLLSTEGYQRWLSYVAHEYFHHYNVKRIRPLALGPFDYDRENMTTMLWVSEGLSVYYQDIVMVRAGLTTRDQYLEKIQGTIARVENATGHRYQSATEASLAAWGGSGIGGDRNTSVSYYDKGPALGVLLDLKIRHDSNNQRSLDDVMRVLYRRYYQEKKRGFTDAEFRLECETAAGGSLAEVFDYASTTRDIDYPKYFAYAGLEIDVAAKDGKGAYLGISTRSQSGKLFVEAVSAGSPAATAGIAEQDEIIELDGAKATLKVLSDLLLAKKPGDRLKVKTSRNNVAREVEVELGTNPQRSFRIRPSATPNPLQAAILKDWLRGEGQ